MAQGEDRRRIELLEDALAECLTWIESSDEYDDQLAPESAWIPRPKVIARPDGSAILSAVHEDAFVNVEALEAEVEKLRSVVHCARAVLDQGRVQGALGRARLRRRLQDRAP